MIAAVLFDVDGTLVDSNDLHAAAWREAFLHFGIDLSLDSIGTQIGKGGDNLIPALLPDLGDSGRQEIEEFRSGLFKRDYLSRVRPFPGVGPLFERLHADGVRIVLATSAGQEELDHHCRLLGRGDLVHATVSKDDVDRSKPCPDIFEAARGKVASIGRDKVVVVGDTPWDMEAAARAGLKSVAVLCGGFDEDWLRESGAVAVFAGPQDLLAAWPGWRVAT